MPTYNVVVTMTTEHHFTITAATRASAQRLGEAHAWIESRDVEGRTPRDVAYLRRHARRVNYYERDESIAQTTVEETPHE
jgi:hypothetical protein